VFIKPFGRSPVGSSLFAITLHAGQSSEGFRIWQVGGRLKAIQIFTGVSGGMVEPQFGIKDAESPPPLSRVGHG
jgi:hypothetical protein